MLGGFRITFQLPVGSKRVRRTAHSGGFRRACVEALNRCACSARLLRCSYGPGGPRRRTPAQCPGGPKAISYQLSFEAPTSHSAGSDVMRGSARHQIRNWNHTGSERSSSYQDGACYAVALSKRGPVDATGLLQFLVLDIEVLFSVDSRL